MPNENEKERRKKQVPAAFEKFAKKSNPKTEVRAMARDEKRRRLKREERGVEQPPKDDKPARKPIIREVEGKQYERAGGYGKPNQDGPRERPKFRGRDDERGGRGFERREGSREGEGRGEGRFGPRRDEERGERRFSPRRDDQRGPRTEGRGGFERSAGFGRGRGGESRGEESRGRFSRGGGFEGGGRGEESRGGFGRGRGGESRGGESRGRFSRGGGFEGGGREGFKPRQPRFFGNPEEAAEADLFEAAWENRGKPRKESKSPVEKRKKAERSLAGDISEPMRLNRFIALSGVCSRREADLMIQKGLVTVNGEVVKELGLKVLNGKDEVIVNGKSLSIKQFVYILMNKPKNVITSTEDEMGRKTVMEIVQHYTSVRVYPVGRLDRNTTGLMLFTNDGDLAKKLTHPSHGFEKLYHARLDKPVSEEHLAQLRIGVELEDGLAQVDDIEYVAGKGRDEVGLKIHIGRNRIVRRMFEHLGYEVVMLDRTQLGPLHKQGIKRGTCRPLTESEIGFLKMIQ